VLMLFHLFRFLKSGVQKAGSKTRLALNLLLRLLY